MKLLLLVPGALMVVVGIVLAGQFDLVGPQFPEGPVGVIGWGLILCGLLEMRLVDAVVG